MKTLLLAVSALVLQLPTVPIAPGARASVEGVVLGPENRPVAGAEVRAWSWPPPMFLNPDQIPQTVSDRDGKFVLNDLASGGYRIRVTAGGYVSQEYGSRAPGAQGMGTGTVLSVGPGQGLQGITINLSGEGIVSGRITSTNGSPLLGMEVHALRKVFDARGWASFAPEGARVTSNDRGEYRIAGLPNGQYYVRAAPGVVRIEGAQLQAVVQGIATPPAPPSPGNFPPTYHPAVTESAKALSVDLKSGVEIRNIDIALQRHSGFKVRGRVIDPAGGVPALATVTASPARTAFSPGISGLFSAYRPDGTFELTDIVPGTYWVHAHLPISIPSTSVLDRPLPPQGAALVTVIDADVENVEVTIVRDLTLTGSVTVEGRSASANELDGIRVELLQLTFGRLSIPMGTLTRGPDGTFAYKNLPVAEFRMTVSGLPADLHLKEARIGSVDALTQFIELTKPPIAPLNIILATGVEVTGAVADVASRPVPNQAVVLIPERLRNRPDLYKTATTDASGRFTMRGVAPGDYKAFAWKTIEPFRYFDPEFLRGFEDRGRVVRVTETSPATIDVKLIP